MTYIIGRKMFKFDWLSRCRSNYDVGLRVLIFTQAHFVYKYSRLAKMAENLDHHEFGGGAGIDRTSDFAHGIQTPIRVIYTASSTDNVSSAFNFVGSANTGANTGAHFKPVLITAVSVKVMVQVGQLVGVGLEIITTTMTKS